MAETPGYFRLRCCFSEQVVPDDWTWLDYRRAVVLDQNDLLAVEKRIRQALEFWRKPGADTTPGLESMRLLVKYLGSAPLIRNPLLVDHIRADQQQILELTKDQYEVLNALEQNRRVIVRGCAGSGKTMLAVEKARRLAVEAHLKVLYVCFNEALSIYIGQILAYTKFFHVFSYYRLVRFWCDRAGMPLEERTTPEGGQAFFETEVPDRLLRIIDKLGPQYDAIVVDEVQDFNQKQWDSLFKCLRHPFEGSIYAFGDDHQRIFPPPQTQPAFAGAPDFVSFYLGSNCRNTKTIAKALNAFYEEARLPKAKGPVGVPVEVAVYKDSPMMQKQLGSVLHRLIAEQQVSSSDIIVLTVRRSKRTDGSLPGPPSELDGMEIGRFLITSKPPESPNQIYTKSIYSFKGLERPVVILSEIDDQIPSEKLWPLLYTAISRAKSHLIVLLSEAAEDNLKSKLRRLSG